MAAWTEAEAETKWCAPAVISAGSSGFFSGQDGSTEITSGRVNCIASECMLWRWFDGTKGYCGFGPVPTGNGP